MTIRGGIIVTLRDWLITHPASLTSRTTAGQIQIRIRFIHSDSTQSHSVLKQCIVHTTQRKRIDKALAFSTFIRLERRKMTTDIKIRICRQRRVKDFWKTASARNSRLRSPKETTWLGQWRRHEGQKRGREGGAPRQERGVWTGGLAPTIIVSTTSSGYG